MAAKTPLQWRVKRNQEMTGDSATTSWKSATTSSSTSIKTTGQQEPSSVYGESIQAQVLTATEAMEVCNLSPSKRLVGRPIEGELGDDNLTTKQIRRYANAVVKLDEWPLADVDLEKVTFETRTRAKRRHGVFEEQGDGYSTIGISQHTIENADWENVKETIRHELVHAWQHQHKGERAELPNGDVVKDIGVGHTGSWYQWEDLMDVQRLNNHYDREPDDYRYILGCSECGDWIGRFRLSNLVREVAQGKRRCDSCGALLYLFDPDTGFRVPHGDYNDYAIRDWLDATE